MSQQKKIRVLHIISGYGGGISSHIRNIAYTIDVNKVSFDVIGFTDYSSDFNDEIAHTGGKTFTFLKPKQVGFWKFYKHAVQVMKENGPYDVVLCHISGHYALVFKAMAKQIGAKRFVVHAHKTQYDKLDGLKDTIKIKMKADQFFSRLTATQMTSCSSEASAFVFGDAPVKAEKVMHIPNSIPPEKYMLSLSEEEIIQMKKENGIPLDKLIVGNMGRFTLQKNHVFMVELIAYMKAQKIPFIWVFVGSGELEDQIKQRISERDLDDCVIFLGRREDGNRLYQMMDVFVLPSLSEGLPTVIVETQAAGIQSVIADTITREVDLGLGMVTYLSLEDNLDLWAKKIVEAAEKNVPALEERQIKIDELGFSNKIAAKIYEDFLSGKMKDFRIGDKYNTH